MPEFPDWDAPQGHANAIAATGVPLLHLKSVLDQKNAVALPGGVTSIFPGVTSTYSVGQVAYEMAFQLTTAAATATAVQVQLRWQDSASGLITWINNFWVYAATAATVHYFVGRGPVRADRLNIDITPTVNNCTVTFTVLASSIPYTRDHWRTVIPSTPPSFPGFTSAVQDPDAGWLGSASASVALSNTDTFLLPLYTGGIVLAGATTDTTAGNSELRIQNAADTFNSPPSQTLYRIANGQGESFKPGIILASHLVLPAIQCELILSNGNASAAETINANVLAYELAAG